MKSIENLEQKLINKKLNSVTNSEPEYLKRERSRIAEKTIKIAEDFYFKSVVPGLLTKLEGLIDNLEIDQKGILYQENGKFNPHFSVKLIWDRERNEFKPMSIGCKTGETHKELTINSFPSGDLAIKGHPLLGSSKFYYRSITAEKALTKGIMHPKIKWEALKMDAK
jgi:hypothetical protein